MISLDLQCKELLNIEDFGPNIRQNQNFKKLEKLRQALWYFGKPLMSEISLR